MSPETTVSAGTSAGTPSRITRALGGLECAEALDGALGLALGEVPDQPIERDDAHDGGRLNGRAGHDGNDGCNGQQPDREAPKLTEEKAYA